MLSNLKTRWLTITILLDLALTLLALLLAWWIRTYFPGGVYLDETFSFVYLDKPLNFSITALVPIIITIWLAIFSALSIYNDQFIVGQYTYTQPIVIAVTNAMLVFAGAAYLLFPELSRFLFFYFYILDLIFLLSWRKIVLVLLNNQHFQSWQPQHRILIVGSNESAQEIVEAIAGLSNSGLKLAGFANDTPEALGTIAQTVEIVEKQAIDEVILALAADQQRTLQQLIFQLQPLSVNLHLIPAVTSLAFVRTTIEDFAGLPLIGVQQPTITPFSRFIKRAFDIVVSSLLILLSFPFSPLIALLIKINSPGPIFYKAQRVGENGKIFQMFKLRTMFTGADTHEANLFIEKNGTIGFDKRPNDPRVTRIGRFLRRASLDEWPQLLNVLSGDMSLVGPRPELPLLVERYKPWEYQRFAVPQGMTGWWQVRNRDQQQTYDMRIEDDLYYIHNYSFLLDLRILLFTVMAVIRGDGAF